MISNPMARWPVSFVAGLVCLGCAALSPAARANDDRPNIVMLISDDQAWTDYSFMGHAHIKTPRLDALARQSVLFRRGYVPTSLCRPSLMTMITGRYAHQHGVTGNDPSPKYAPPQSELNRQQREQLISHVDRFDILPKRLANAGYECFQSGKWWEGSYQRGGFTHGMTRGFPQPGGRHGDDGLEIGRKGMDPVYRFMEDAVARDQPFFVWYAPFLPHAPHTPPPRLLKKYSGLGIPATVAKYDAMCEWFDETCGALLDKLDQLKVADNTIVVYVCDNGWIQNPDANGYAPRSKQTPYEGGVRTPIMFRWPGKWPAADRPDLCSSIDLMPTLMSAVGEAAPADLPGLDLTPTLAQGRPVPRKIIFGEGFAHDIADLENPEASLLYRWCIEDNWKLILTYDGEVNRYQSSHPRSNAGAQLFDLGQDPTEQHNLAATHPEEVRRLAASIAAWYPLKTRRILTSSNEK